MSRYEAQPEDSGGTWLVWDAVEGDVAERTPGQGWWGLTKEYAERTASELNWNEGYDN